MAKKKSEQVIGSIGKPSLDEIIVRAFEGLALRAVAVGAGVRDEVLEVVPVGRPRDPASAITRPVLGVGISTPLLAVAPGVIRAREFLPEPTGGLPYDDGCAG